MPSFRVAAENLLLAMFDVVGKDGGEATFIGHIGLVKSSGLHTPTKVSVLDMGPPLHGERNPNHIRADIVGSATLTDDEVQRIRTFIDRHTGEHLSFSQLRPRELIARAENVLRSPPRHAMLRGRWSLRSNAI